MGLNISKQYLTPNPYSRPQIPLKKVTKVAWHYVGNPKSTAQNNRNYFENLKNTKATKVSSHYVIGLQGEIIQCIPENEYSYCTNAANGYSISIEVCHPDTSGKFNPATEQALIALTADILTATGSQQTISSDIMTSPGSSAPATTSPTQRPTNRQKSG